MSTEFRHEYKYLCSPGQLVLTQRRLEHLLQRDPHVEASGSYLIRSIYFDTPDNRCYYENEDGVSPRYKYRVRIYNCSGDRITLERKWKVRGMTHKDACTVTREQCGLLMRGEIPLPGGESPPLLAEMLTDMRGKLMGPAVIVQYLRTPFVSPVGNVRVTLDRQISSSHAIDRFFERDIPLRQVLPGGRGVLEVKWDRLLPSWLYDSLQLETMQWTGFSKYYLCRKFNSMGEEIL